MRAPSRPLASSLICSFVSLALLGCATADLFPDDSEVGSAELEVALVPTGVKCIHVRAKGATTLAKSFTVTTASSTTLSLGRVPLGDVVFEGFAFDAACPSSTTMPTGQPSWVADPTEMEVFAGAATTVPFVFRKNSPANGTVNFVEPVADISPGFQSVAAMLDGTVRQWGNGLLVPTPVAGLTQVVQVATSSFHACALRSDRTLWCWGANTFGQLGDGTTTSRNVPGQVMLDSTAGVALTDVVDVSLGANHGCAITGSKALFCWGYNDRKQVGDGTTVPRTTAFQVLSNALKVAAAGSHTCAQMVSGYVTCWGDNLYGQLGSGQVGSPAGPTMVQNLKAVVDLAAGQRHSCALRADGAAFCWGDNQSGELGDGTTNSRAYPALVSGLADVVQLDLGGAYSCATLADGSARCWGSNASGQLGSGDGIDSTIPVAVRGLGGTVRVAAGSEQACALSENGAASCWGSNFYGQLGDGTNTTRFVPVPVSF